MVDKRKPDNVIPVSSLYRPKKSEDSKRQSSDSTQFPKKALYHANYTKENYNILTLQSHNDYYKQYQKQIPIYAHQEPDWSKSLYKRKNNKVTKYNYILYRNVRNVSGKGNKDRQSVISNEGYASSKKNQRSFVGSSSKQLADQESLPLILQKKKQKEQSASKVKEMCKRSLSSYCGSKASKMNKSSVASCAVEKTQLSEAERMIQRGERLGKFVKELGKDATKKIASTYAKMLLDKAGLSDITKEQIKIAIENPIEDIEKKIGNAIGEQKEEKKEEQEEKESEKAEGQEPEKKEEHQELKEKEIEERIAELIKELIDIQKKKDAKKN